MDPHIHARLLALALRRAYPILLLPSPRLAALLERFRERHGQTG